MSAVNHDEPITEAEVVPATVDVDVAAPTGSPCEACGSPIEPNEKFCSACGNPCRPAVEEPEENPLETVAPPQQFFRCKNCGSEVATVPGHRSYVCAFCDSAYVVEYSRDAGRMPPEFVIGFAVTPAEARQKFQAWIGKNSWFRPGDLRQARIEDKIQGVYIPFWSFSMLANSQWSANIGEYWYRTETYWTTDSKGKRVQRTRQVRETEWWPLQGRHHRYYSGYLVSGSRGLPQSYADRIKPFQLPALKRYDSHYLAGWLCEEYSVSPEDALKVSRQAFIQAERDNVAQFMPGDTHQGLDVSTEFSNVNSDLCLLPIYVLGYQYKDELYRFIVNGQTGKIYGDKPVSGRRIALAVGMVLLLVVLVAVVVAVLNSL